VKLLLVVSILVASFSSRGQDNAFRQLIEDHLKTFPDRTEVSIAIVDHGEIYKMGYRVSKGNLVGIENFNSVFEIGSITKTFTASLLMDEIAKNKMGLDDPIQKHLRVSMKQDSFQGHTITIKHLITHTSGLGRIKLDGTLNDYLSYLKGFELDYVPGKTWAYNNFAVALLGEFLAANNQSTYERLIRDKIFSPLDMNHSYLHIADFADSLKVVSYDVGGRKKAYWEMGFIKPAGAIKSDLNDMIKWLTANLNDPGPKLKFIHDAHNTMGDSVFISGTNVTMGLGWWHYRPDSTTRVIYHEGGTFGQTAFLGLDPDNKRGVVILSNFSSAHKAMQSGKGINNPKGGLSKPAYMAFQLFKIR
jgi:CubicO group peptidase (beta-lactamase class C family)